MTELAFLLKHDGFRTGEELLRFSSGVTVTAGNAVEEVIIVLSFLVGSHSFGLNFQVWSVDSQTTRWDAYVVTVKVDMTLEIAGGVMEI